MLVKDIMRFKYDNLERFERLLLLTIIVGVMFRIIAAYSNDILYDGPIYAGYADAIVRHGEIYLDWGQLYPFGENNPADHSQWYPPLFPMYLALWIAPFGFTPFVLKTANVTLSLITLAAVFYTTRDLYDRRKALAATAVMAAHPVLLLTTSYGFSENIVVLTYIAAVWAVLRGFKDQKYLVLGGFLAGLCYLSRANVGYLFVLIGAVGLAWRFYYDRWSLFKNRYYIGAVAAFAAVFLSWTLRNISHFGPGGWETNPLITEMMWDVVTHPAVGAWGILNQALSTIILFLPFFIFFTPEWAAGLRRWREEYFSSLLIATILPFVVTAVFMVGYYTWFVVHNAPAAEIWLGAVRYLVITAVPMLWFAFAAAKFTRREERVWWDEGKGEKTDPWYSRLRVNGKERAVTLLGTWQFKAVVVVAVLAFAVSVASAPTMPLNFVYGLFILAGLVTVLFVSSARRRVTTMIAVLLAVSILIAADPVTYGHVKACQSLNEMMDENDTLALDTTLGNVSWGTIYALYPYLEHRDEPPVYYEEGVNTSFILTWWPPEPPEGHTADDNLNKTYPGYTYLGAYETEHALGTDLPPFREFGTWYVWEESGHYRERVG